MRRREALLGIISDTHGLLRAEAIGALRGSDFIIHAGDVGTSIGCASLLRPTSFAETWTEGHDTLDPAAAGHAAVVFGHSHVPSVETRDGVLFLNSGSAGPRRFKLPVTLARAHRASDHARDSAIAGMKIACAELRRFDRCPCASRETA